MPHCEQLSGSVTAVAPFESLFLFLLLRCVLLRAAEAPPSSAAATGGGEDERAYSWSGRSACGGGGEELTSPDISRDKHRRYSALIDQ